MDHIYIILAVLIILGIVDLIVGVSNDAVNFLNSAIGSKVAKRKYIYMVAGAGIVLGSMFSGGMMEVARKGIFNPHIFYLDQLLIIFIAVMFTDIILIDLFNTFGYPTSTTVAIVFELLGGVLALGLVIIGGENPDNINIQEVINTNSAITILLGIIISIIVAFIIGAFVQFIARLIFTFNYKGKFKFLFSVAGALAITSIFFLILKKDPAVVSVLGNYIKGLITNIPLLLSVIFSISLLIFLLLSVVFSVDIPKVVVFAGTFTIALSFASNDLINFIGIPLSGIEGIKVFKESGALNTNGFLMDIWRGGFLSNVWGEGIYSIIYLISAVIMVITLFTSRKLRSVTETEMYLGRQDSGYETFEASNISRRIVSKSLLIHNKLRSKIPHKYIDAINKRYEREAEFDLVGEKVVYFDTVRASVNLVVASVLVALGTYFTIPLSTTFVVFMVVMGTSLADQAWGKESAVYRISGVLSILGGWFITAIMGFIGAFIFTLIIYWGNIYAIGVLALIAIYVFFHTTKYHRKVYHQQLELNRYSNKQIKTSMGSLVELGSDRIRKHILETSKIYMLIIQGFVDDNEGQLKETKEKTKLLDKVAKRTKEELFNSFSSIENTSFETEHYFVQALDYLSELSNTLKQISQPVFNHVKNKHKGLSESQKEDTLLLLEEMTGFFNYLVHIEKESRFDSVPEMIEKQKYLVDLIEALRKKQIKRVMSGGGRTRCSMLLLECYAESKNLVLYTINLLKSHRDFYLNTHL